MLVDSCDFIFNRLLLAFISRVFVSSASWLLMIGTPTGFCDEPSVSVPPLAEVDSYKALVNYAQQAAKAPFVPPPPLPQNLAELSYAQYSKIQFRYPAATWWNGDSPYWLETFHRGFVQNGRVELFTIDDGQVAAVPFSTEKFDYQGVIDPANIPADVGHAGVKIVGRFPAQDDGQEMLTFLGSSYFRSRTDETVYGSSARGLALNVAMNQDEEFPMFRTFWIVRPKRGTSSAKIFAHLDSPSVSGAYQFEFTPGTTESIISVQAKLFFRTTVEKVAIAPLTSMWMWGDGLAGPPEDNRPSVHDADGVLIHSEEDGWIWRPFARQTYPSTSYHRVETLLGFGVLQRHRAFFNYEDYNADYHKRPSIWIKPKTAWKQGRVELLELPAEHEGIDNIGAYWVFEKNVSPDEPVELDYDVSFFGGDFGGQKNIGRATDFRITRNDSKNWIEAEIRYTGPAVAENVNDDDLRIDARIHDGEILDQWIKKTRTNDLLVTIRFRPINAQDTDRPINLELEVLDNNQKLTETFWYLCPPQNTSWD